MVVFLNEGGRHRFSFFVFNTKQVTHSILLNWCSLWPNLTSLVCFL